MGYGKNSRCSAYPKTGVIQPIMLLHYNVPTTQPGLGVLFYHHHVVVMKAKENGPPYKATHPVNENSVAFIHNWREQGTECLCGQLLGYGHVPTKETNSTIDFQE